MDKGNLKPNILFIVIDSLRSDKCYGDTKTSKTPNIDSLIENGLCFEKAISSVDATDPSLGCIFTGKYPFKTGISLYKNHAKASRFFDILKDHGYHRYATIPNKSFFKTLTIGFELQDIYSVDPYVLLYEGTGQQIIDMLNGKMKEPWVYYIHLMDLHPTGGKFIFPNEFNDPKYGISNYEKTVSAIDPWIGKFLDKINLQNTLLILSADHGDYIPITGTRLGEIEKTQKILKKIKQLVPSLEPLGLRVFILLRNFASKIRKFKLQQTFDEYQMRTFGKRTDFGLYDEIINVPLIFAGYGINKKKVTQQVRLIDILPTVLDLIGIKEKEPEIDGRNLLSFLSKKQMDDIPVYIETASTNPINPGNSIGIRTSNYKYFRSRTNKEKLYLFDLINDPLEKNNIANTRLDLVERMEKILESMLNSDATLNEKESLKKLISKKRSDFNLQE